MPCRPQPSEHWLETELPCLELGGQESVLRLKERLAGRRHSLGMVEGREEGAVRKAKRCNNRNQDSSIKQLICLQSHQCGEPLAKSSFKNRLYSVFALPDGGGRACVLGGPLPAACRAGSFPQACRSLWLWAQGPSGPRAPAGKPINNAGQ